MTETVVDTKGYRESKVKSNDSPAVVKFYFYTAYLLSYQDGINETREDLSGVVGVKENTPPNIVYDSIVELILSDKKPEEKQFYGVVFKELKRIS